VVRAQREWRRDPALATTVGRALFPDLEAGLIAGLIERDADYYDPTVSHDAVTGLAAFARVTGLTSRALDYDDIVADGMAPLRHADEQPGSGR
jgi:NitT/TauT family transport system substrate-binding protein